MTETTEKYFCFRPDEGMDYFDTEAEARAAAQAAVDDYRHESADDGWDLEVEEIRWGVVRQRAKLREQPDVFVETDEGQQHPFDAQLEDVE